MSNSCVFSPQNCKKKTSKIVKNKVGRGVSDMVFIRFGYGTMDKKVFLIYLKLIRIPKNLHARYVKVSQYFHILVGQ